MGAAWGTKCAGSRQASGLPCWPKSAWARPDFVDTMAIHKLATGDSYKACSCASGRTSPVEAETASCTSVVVGSMLPGSTDQEVKEASHATWNRGQKKRTICQEVVRTFGTTHVANCRILGRGCQDCTSKKPEMAEHAGTGEIGKDPVTYASSNLRTNYELEVLVSLAKKSCLAARVFIGSP